MVEILQSAINLIKQGKKQAARSLLEELLRSQPNQAAHWLWYAETLDTPQQRVKVLELCLKANPGNAQAEKALEILRAKISPPAPAIDPGLDFDWDEDASDSGGDSLSSDWAAPPVSAPQSKPAFDWDALENQSAAPKVEAAAAPAEFSWEDEQEQPERGVVWEHESDLSDEPVLSSGAPIDWEAIEQAQQPARPKAAVVASEPVKPVKKKKKEPAPVSYAFYDVWLTALTSNKKEAYQDLLRDPEAGQARAYEWMAYIGLLSGLLLPLLSLSQFNTIFGEVFPNVAPVALMVLVFAASAIFSCLSAVLGLMIGAGIQFLIALLLGGRGSFGHTVYALAAYLAPYTIISTVIGVIPFVQCISPLVAIYGLILNARALAAAHDFAFVRALMVILLPSILLLMVGCLIGVVFAPALSEILPALP